MIMVVVQGGHCSGTLAALSSRTHRKAHALFTGFLIVAARKERAIERHTDGTLEFQIPSNMLQPKHLPVTASTIDNLELAAPVLAHDVQEGHAPCRALLEEVGLVEEGSGRGTVTHPLGDLVLRLQGGIITEGGAGS